jgi:hypothetical protein
MAGPGTDSPIVPGEQASVGYLRAVNSVLVTTVLALGLGAPEILILILALVPLLVLALIVVGIVLAVRGRRRRASEMQQLRNEVEELRKQTR